MLHCNLYIISLYEMNEEKENSREQKNRAAEINCAKFKKKTHVLSTALPQQFHYLLYT